MRRLVLPAALQVTALTLSCSSVSPAPSPADARADTAADTATDSPTDTSPPRDVADACVIVDADPFVPGGFACAPSRNAPSSMQCPSDRFCEASQCPAGCDGCASPLFCIPGMLPDGGRPSSCLHSTTCVSDGCGEGCMAVG